MSTKKLLHEQKLWKNWMAKGDNQAANELIQHYMYLVSFHVERISSHLPNNISKEDIQSLGLFGLYDALTKFDTGRNLKFDTYASFRIRGAIMDGLRKDDWLSRSVREKAKKVEQLAQELEKTLKRAPTAPEIAEQTDMSTAEVEAAVKDSLFGNILSMEEKPKDGKGDKKEGIGYTIADNALLRPEENLLANELKEELIAGIKMLSEKEQLVISLFYKEELTLTEIGEVMGLTTSRISQIHKKTIFKLRKTLSKIQEST